ncbi:MAG: class I SAM-dependent methyltransferase [SAR202 cluster bacterium]|nr:class I SAM-dependent methyltransferase [SAR202 cluster bacterium]
MAISPKPQRSAREQFGATAANYTVSAGHRGGESLSVVTELIAKGGRRFDRAVDIATGPGFTAFAAAPHAGSVLATDPTPQMLREVRKLRRERGIANVGMALVVAETLPFADESLDLVTCRTAPHHFLDVPRWLGECRRVLKPDGVFVLADTCAPEDPELAAWMNDMEVRRDPSHVRNYAPSEWVRLVREAGLDVTDEALCILNQEMPDWAHRSNSTPAMTEELARDFRNASPAAKEHFAIAPRDDGTIGFRWFVAILRAEKP